MKDSRQFPTHQHLNGWRKLRTDRLCHWIKLLIVIFNLNLNSTYKERLKF